MVWLCRHSHFCDYALKLITWWKLLQMPIYRLKISIQNKNITIISIRLFVSICISTGDVILQATQPSVWQLQPKGCWDFWSVAYGVGTGEVNYRYHSRLPLFVLWGCSSQNSSSHPVLEAQWCSQCCACRDTGLYMIYKTVEKNHIVFKCETQNAYKKYYVHCLVSLLENLCVV